MNLLMSWNSVGETLHLHELCLGFSIYFFLGCPSEWKGILRSGSDLVQLTTQTRVSSEVTPGYLRLFPVRSWESTKSSGLLTAW